jgi:hypothetical protein
MLDNLSRYLRILRAHADHSHELRHVRVCNLFCVCYMEVSHAPHVVRDNFQKLRGTNEFYMSFN